MDPDILNRLNSDAWKCMDRAAWQRLREEALSRMDGADAGGGEEGQEGSGLLWNAQTIKLHAVQCAKCGKYRSIPFKKTYERIRAKIFEQPWVCENAFAWNAKASCEAPDEFIGKSHLVFAVDKPGVPVTPPGWDRSVHIRAGPGNEHFSDIFYFAPGNGTRSSRRLRSIKGVERYIEQNPEASIAVSNLRKVFCFRRPYPSASSGIGKKGARWYVERFPEARPENPELRKSFSFARPTLPSGFGKRFRTPFRFVEKGPDSD